MAESTRKELEDALAKAKRELAGLSGAQKDYQKTVVAALEANLRSFNKLNDEVEETRKNIENLRDATDDWGQALFGVNLGRFIEENQNYNEQIQDIANNIALAEQALAEFENKTVNGFARLATYIQNDSVKIAELAEATNDLAQLDPGLAAKLDEAMADPNKIIGLWENMTKEQQKMLFETINKKDGLKDLANYFNPKNSKGPKLQEMKQGIKDLEKEMQNVAKYSFNFSEAFEKILKNIGESVGPQKLIRGLREFDNQLAGIKKEFQLPTDSFDSAKVAMDEMVQKGAQFGLSTADSFAMVKTLGDEARSTNVANLAATAQELAAIPAATGIASQEVAQIAGKMVFFGASAEQAKSAFTSISKQAITFGVNVTKTSKIFAENLSRFQRMGFKAGEESLSRMAAKAAKVGIDLNKLMDASDKFLDINTALEASADLSLLGGAAAQTSFLDLMKAAQEGPEAMDKLFDQMTSDIGKLDKSGKLQLNMIDRQRLAKIAEATGEDVETLTNRINSRLQDQAKKAQFSPKMFDALKPEEKEFLLSKTVKDKTGKFKVEGMEGVKDLKEIGPAQIAAMKKKAEDDAKNAEKAAEARRSFDESITALSGSFIALVNGLQPVLGALTTGINFFVDIIGKFTNFLSTNLSPGFAAFIKGATALVIALAFSFGPARLAAWTGGLFRALMSPLQTLGGIGSKLKDAFKGVGGKAAEKVSADLGGKKTDLTGGVQEPKKAGFLEQLKGISPAQILSIAAAIVALGIAFLLIGKGIQFASEGLAVLVKSFNDTKNAGMALAAVAIVMGGFVAMLAIMIPVIGALGAVATPVAIPLIALGVAFLLMGAGVALAAMGLAKLVESVGKMGKSVNNLFTAAAGIGALALSLYAISPALLFFGAAGLFAMPAMIALAAGLAIVSVSMKLITPVITALSSVKSDGISALGKNLLPLSLGLLSLVPVGMLAAFILAGAVAAVIASGAISILGKSLSSIKGLDPKIISSFANGLNTLFFPLMKFALVGVVSPALILAGVGLMAITKGLSYLKDIDLKNVTALPSVLKSLVGSLFLFSTVGVVSGLLILSGLGLAAVTGALSLLKGVNIAGATALSNILPKLGAGLALFALAGIAAPYGILAAGVLIIISKALQLIGGVDVTKLKTFGDSLSSLGKGLGLFSLAGITAPLSILAATALMIISKALSLVGTVDIKNLSGLGQSLGSLGLGLAKFSAAGLLAPFAILAGAALVIVSKAIGLVSNVDSKKIIDLGNSLPTIGNGLIRFSLAGFTAPLSIAAAGALLIVSKALTLIGNIDTAKLNPLGGVLSNLGFGLIKFSLAGITAGLSILAAGALLIVSKALTLIGGIDTAKLIPLANVLPMLGFGLLKFSIAGITAPLSILAAGALVVVAKAISIIGAVDTTKITALGNSLPSLGMGLFKFSLAGIVAPLSILAAGALIVISKALTGLATIDTAKIQSLGSSISSLGIGLIKFSIAGLTAPLAILAAGALFVVSKAISLIGAIDATKIISLGTTLPLLGNGLLKFGIGGLLAPLAILGAGALIVIAKALSFLGPIDPAKITTLAQSLPSLGAGLFKFSLSGIVAPLGIVAAGSLVLISKALSLIGAVDTAKIIALGNSLPSIGIGLIKFGLAGFLAPLAILAAGALIVISKAFTFLGPVDTAKIIALGNSLPMIGTGLLKFSIAGILAPLAILGAVALSVVGKALSSMGNLDPVKLLTFATTLPVLGTGLLRFSIAGITAPLSILAAGALLLVSKALSLIGPVDPVKMITLSSVLPTLGSGLLKFSISGLGAPLAVLAAGALILVTKALSNIGVVNPVQLISLANTLPSIGMGLLKFSAAGLVAPLATIAAGALFLITRSLGAVGLVDPVKLMSLGISLPKIGLGIISFAAAGMFAPLAILGALALIPITKALALTSTVDLKNTLFLSTILRSLGPAMMVFGLSGFLAPMAMLSAGTLAVIAKAFSYFKGVDVLPLMSLGNVLKNVSGGILTFSAVGLLAGGAILGSISLIAIGKAMQIASQGFIVFATVPWASLAGVAPILQSLLSSFAKMGLLGILAAPGMLAIAGTLRILGASMSSVTNGFAASAKAMADFNIQLEKLKANSKGIETVNVAQLQKINEAATKAGPRSTGPAPVTVGTTAQSVKIAPIEINLKLNGRDLQQLIVEANYNRS